MRRGLLLVLLLPVCACDTAEPSACDPFADRKLAITAAEYGECATEILKALDAIEPSLRSIVADSATHEERGACKRAHGRLRTLIRRTGMEADYRSMRPGTELMKWSNSAVSAFNRAAFNASVQYGAVLAYPNADNFAQGVRAHEEARRHYRAIR